MLLFIVTTATIRNTEKNDSWLIDEEKLVRIEWIIIAVVCFAFVVFCIRFVLCVLFKQVYEECLFRELMAGVRQ